ncbi:hypothetical protein GCM10011390_10870 [Aureimonas endophytica]|uniref:Uncharacterized protein n=1 Tax=Aureimonas endophytica TaxID=2027858 RepID=A0A916ZFC0_9HYPH|nr:hypothetical protein [Aureimonas endophytica]GGD93978.1 hypothetical protein GCM10011390_10870 [Aureimonas endophytica]
MPLTQPRRAITGFRLEPIGGAACRFLLLTLGVTWSEAEALTEAPSSATLPAALRQRCAERLGRERQRLARLARVGSPAYDLNRHLAVHAAARWLGALRTGGAPAAPQAVSSEVSRAGAFEAPRSSENCIMKRGRSDSGIGRAK